MTISILYKKLNQNFYIWLNKGEPSSKSKYEI